MLLFRTSLHVKDGPALTSVFFQLDCEWQVQAPHPLQLVCCFNFDLDYRGRSCTSIGMSLVSISFGTTKCLFKECRFAIVSLTKMRSEKADTLI